MQASSGGMPQRHSASFSSASAGRAASAPGSRSSTGHISIQTPPQPRDSLRVSMSAPRSYSAAPGGGGAGSSSSAAGAAGVSSASLSPSSASRPVSSSRRSTTGTDRGRSSAPRRRTGERKRKSDASSRAERGNREPHVTTLVKTGMALVIGVLILVGLETSSADVPLEWTILLSVFGGLGALAALNFIADPIYAYIRRLHLVIFSGGTQRESQLAAAGKKAGSQSQSSVSSKESGTSSYTVGGLVPGTIMASAPLRTNPRTDTRSPYSTSSRDSSLNRSGTGVGGTLGGSSVYSGAGPGGVGSIPRSVRSWQSGHSGSYYTGTGPRTGAAVSAGAGYSPPNVNHYFPANGTESGDSSSTGTTASLASEAAAMTLALAAGAKANLGVPGQQQYPSNDTSITMSNTSNHWGQRSGSIMSPSLTWSDSAPPLDAAKDLKLAPQCRSSGARPDPSLSTTPGSSEDSLTYNPAIHGSISSAAAAAGRMSTTPPPSASFHVDATSVSTQGFACPRPPVSSITSFDAASRQSIAAAAAAQQQQQQQQQQQTPDSPARHRGRSMSMRSQYSPSDSAAGAGAVHMSANAISPHGGGGGGGGGHYSSGEDSPAEDDYDDDDDDPRTGAHLRGHHHHHHHEFGVRRASTSVTSAFDVHYNRSASPSAPPSPAAHHHHASSRSGSGTQGRSGSGNRNTRHRSNGSGGPTASTSTSNVGLPTAGSGSSRYLSVPGYSSKRNLAVASAGPPPPALAPSSSSFRAGGSLSSSMAWGGPSTATSGTSGSGGGGGTTRSSGVGGSLSSGSLLGGINDLFLPGGRGGPPTLTRANSSGHAINLGKFSGINISISDDMADTPPPPRAAAPSNAATAARASDAGPSVQQQPATQEKKSRRGFWRSTTIRPELDRMPPSSSK
ncbi:hypothetical protein H9P43_006187 [Blastocladiella emersonii ATCC 22665]|nr:hypothetical protein H9P43_006187 [Blastocladiella emersonii ATCC 22665]